MKNQAKVKESVDEFESPDVPSTKEPPKAPTGEPTSEPTAQPQNEPAAEPKDQPVSARQEGIEKPEGSQPGKRGSLKEHILRSRAEAQDAGQSVETAKEAEPHPQDGQTGDGHKKPDLKQILVRAEAAAVEDLERRKLEKALERTEVTPSARLEAARAVVSVVVVTRDSEAALDACLTSVLCQTQPFELIVVNNGNAPEVTASLFALADRDDRVVLITGQGDVGFSKACNMGARAARGDYLCILAPECVLPNSTLKDLVHEGLGLQKPWALGPKLVTPEGFERTGYRREKLTPWRAAVAALGLQRFSGHPLLRGLNQPEETCPDETAEVPVLSGAPLLMPMSDYWSIDGMDERYGEYLGSSDFCDRFSKEGGRICFAPALEVRTEAAADRRRPAYAAHHKMKSLPRYFLANYSKNYPAPVLWAGVAGSWIAYGSLFCLHRARDAVFATVQTMRRSLV